MIMANIVILIAFVVGMAIGILFDMSFGKDGRKHAYLYAIDEQTGEWKKVNALDLTVTLCDTIKTVDKP